MCGKQQAEVSQGNSRAWSEIRRGQNPKIHRARSVGMYDACIAKSTEFT